MSGTAGDEREGMTHSMVAQPVAIKGLSGPPAIRADSRSFVVQRTDQEMIFEVSDELLARSNATF